MTNKQTYRHFNLQDIWKKMNEDEQYKLTYLSMCGSHGANDKKGNMVIYMGSVAMRRIYDYKLEMITKYGHLRSL